MEGWDGYFDRGGNEITSAERSRLSREPGYKIVEQTKVGGVNVSTVWLGSGHGLYEGKPLIFETLVFGSPDDSDGDRYNSEEAARAGHAAFVEKWGKPHYRLTVSLKEFRKRLGGIEEELDEAIAEADDWVKSEWL